MNEIERIRKMLDEGISVRQNEHSKKWETCGQDIDDVSLAIEQYVNDKLAESRTSEIKLIEENLTLRKEHKQYVIKARIEELHDFKAHLQHEDYWWLFNKAEERIAELKKGDSNDRH